MYLGGRTVARVACSYIYDAERIEWFNTFFGTVAHWSSSAFAPFSWHLGTFGAAKVGCWTELT